MLSARIISFGSAEYKRSANCRYISAGYKHSVNNLHVCAEYKYSVVSVLVLGINVV